MRMSSRALLFGTAALALAALPSAASAQGQSAGLYLEGQAGYVVTRDLELSADLLGNRATGDIEVEDSFVYGGELGYALGNGFRFSAGLSNRSAEFDNATATVLGTTTNFGSLGEVSLTTLMGNAYYDFDLGLPLKPFIGGGVGYAFADFEVPFGDNPSLDDQDGAAAWSLMAGASLVMTQNISLGAKYRYLTVNEAQVSGSFNLGPLGTVDEELDVGDLNLHELMVTVTYRF